MSNADTFNLAEAVKSHGLWLIGDPNGKKLIVPSYANLSYADLRYANLSYADLSYADLLIEDVNRIIHLKSIVPADGSFVGYKKVYNSKMQSVILKLEITDDSARLGGLVGRKCRAKKVTVLDIAEGYDKDENVFFSAYDKQFTYEVGKTYEIDNFNNSAIVECAPGIHFYITKQEAIEHN